MGWRTIAVVAVAATLNAAPAMGADLLPVDRGYYVQSDTACERASNATITLYNGSSFGNAHAECRRQMVLERRDGSYKITEQCRDMQGHGDPWAAMVTTYVVLSRTEFVL